MAENRHSAHATFDLKYHVVWCTKYRYKILAGRVAERARDLIRQVCQSRDVVIIRGAVSPDHVHICYCRHHRFCRRRNWRNTSKAGPAGCCRRSFRSCENGIGDSICGRVGISARRWAQWTRRRSRPILKTKSGTKTRRGSRSQRPPSLKPALSRRTLQTASAVTATFSRKGFYRLSAGSL